MRPLALLALLTAVAAAPAAAEVRRVEAVGAVGLGADDRWTTPPRDAAVRRALSDAVMRVALEQLPDRPAPERLAAALGGDPFVYASRFRILEDRGERPALLLVDEPGVTREYVVMLEAYVDADRVRERLAGAGLLDAPSGDAGRRRVEVEVLGLGGYDDYAAVRGALRQRSRSESVIPLEIERGRAVFEVRGRSGPQGLLEALRADLALELVEQDAETLVLRLQGGGRPGAADAEPGPFDTPSRNRY